MKRSKKKKIPTKTKKLIKQITPTEFAMQHKQKKPEQTPFLLLTDAPASHMASLQMDSAESEKDTSTQFCFNSSQRRTPPFAS